jgi:hypothetical protein
MRRSWKGPLKVRFKDAENQKKEEDPVIGGGPELVPEQEQPPEESGLEIGHQAREQRKLTPCESSGIPHGVQPVPIAQIRPTTGFMVEVAVQGVPVQAVVDTGAEVNVLSMRVYDELNPRLPIKQHVTMTLPR